MADPCADVLKASPELLIEGYTPSETTKSICRARDYVSKGRSAADEVVGIRTSYWPQLAKAVEGGLKHIVSVDNGANYAELWAQGGNWYTVTGAEFPEDGTLRKSKTAGVYALRGLKKGMSLEEATATFLKGMFGTPPLKKGGCNCGQK